MPDEVNEEVTNGTENTLVQSSPVLPHGVGFRIIERADEAKFIPEKGIWFVSASHQYTGNEVLELKDHFPGAPIFPGILALEAQAQTALQILSEDTSLTDKVFVFSGIKNANFRRLMNVGLYLTHECEILHDGRYGIASCRTFSGNVTYVTAEFSFAIIRKNKGKKEEKN